MIRKWQWAPSFPDLYFFKSRLLTHLIFWAGYYLLFSVIWYSPEKGYFASFYLEFILMPARILAAYAMIYMLIPNYLAARRYRGFCMGYGLLVLGAGLVQMLVGFFFFSQLMPTVDTGFTLSLSSWVRNALLVNTTVLLLGTVKIFQMYIAVREQLETAHQHAPAPAESHYIEVKAERRIFRLRISDILYLEGMGNYVTYHLLNGEKKVVYSSLKEAQKSLPPYFIRAHRSYVINVAHIDSYTAEQIFVKQRALPRGKDIPDEALSLNAGS